MRNCPELYNKIKLVLNDLKNLNMAGKLMGAPISF